MVRFINLLLTIHYICFHLVKSSWKKPELGYDKDFKINEEQAATIRLIYWLFISGLSLYAITKELESRGIKSPSGKDRWHISTVKSILTNEKYRGDALLQKQYTTDFLQKKRKTNNGEIPQYYVEEHHEAIIPPA